MNQGTESVIQSIWQDFLKIAHEEVGSRVVETWFKAVSLQRWDAVEKKSIPDNTQYFCA